MTQNNTTPETAENEDEYELFDPATVSLRIYDSGDEVNLSEGRIPDDVDEFIEDTVSDVMGDTAEAEKAEEVGRQIADAMSASQISLYLSIEEGMELPIYTSDRTGTWHSVVSEYGNAGGELPTEPFFDALAEIPVDDDDGWGNPSREAWEGMTDAEQSIIESARHTLVRGMASPELAFLFKYADELKNQHLN